MSDDNTTTNLSEQLVSWGSEILRLEHRLTRDSDLATDDEINIVERIAVLNDQIVEYILNQIIENASVAHD